jgi:hypothetical protein
MRPEKTQALVKRGPECPEQGFALGSTIARKAGRRNARETVAKVFQQDQRGRAYATTAWRCQHDQSVPANHRWRPLRPAVLAGCIPIRQFREQDLGSLGQERAGRTRRTRPEGVEDFDRLTIAAARVAQLLRPAQLQGGGLCKTALTK